ncbi:MAG: hypothetical protein LBQ98_02040 [Nitrososphaerota archaeon]|nr:hypothetical protein [Nitrososphaerota archaeon]
MNLGIYKILSGIGALAIALDGVPSLRGISLHNIAKISGNIFVLFSLYKLPIVHQIKNIFTNIKFGAIVAMIGTILVFVFGIVSPSITPLLHTSLYIVLTLAMYMLFCTSITFFIRHILNDTTTCSCTTQFTTTVQVLFIVTVLGALVLSLIIMWIGFLLFTFAFFKMKIPQFAPQSAISIRGGTQS